MISPDAKTWTRLIFKFKVAVAGLIDGLLHDFSIQLQFVSGTIALIVASVLKFSSIEWCIWLLCIGLVITLEFINSSLETILDRMDPSFHILTKKAKDLGSAAVLISAVTSLIIGIIIILNHL